MIESCIYLIYIILIKFIIVCIAIIIFIYIHAVCKGIIEDITEFKTG